MPYQLNWEPHGVHKVFSGYVSEGEFLQSANDVHGDERFDTMKFAINDFSNVTGHGLTERTFKHYSALTIGSTYSSHNLIHTIFVTTDAPLCYAIQSHLQEGAGMYRTLIVSSLSEARDLIRQNKLNV